MRVESLLRNTRLLMLHTDEVLDRVDIKVFASCLSCRNPEVADQVGGADESLIRALIMLLESI